MCGCVGVRVGVCGCVCVCVFEVVADRSHVPCSLNWLVGWRVIDQ